MTKVLLHHAQLFRGLSLGYMHRALHEVDTESRARAESMADAYEIVATTLEASAQVEALPERGGENVYPGLANQSPEQPRSESAPDWKCERTLEEEHVELRREAAEDAREMAARVARPDFKPAKRIKDPSALTALHSMDTGCLLCGNRPVSAHHLLSRSLGGDDVLENLVLLCGDGTRGCHGFVERHDPDVCRLLRVSLSPEQIDYLVGKKSFDWLDNRYPETL